MCKNEVIDKYMFCFMQNIKKCTGKHNILLADLNIGHCVKLTFFGGKMGGFFVVNVLKFLL